MPAMTSSPVICPQWLARVTAKLEVNSEVKSHEEAHMEGGALACMCIKVTMHGRVGQYMEYCVKHISAAD